MNPSRVIPVVTTGYTKTFFTLDLDAIEMTAQKHLRLNRFSKALFAVTLGDDGLSSLSVRCGDYLLFSTTSPLRSSGQISLVRQEDEYIIRETYWDGDTTLLRVPSDVFAPLTLPTENIRITAVLVDVIKDNELAPVVWFDT